MDRCIMSAQTQLNGLYPPHGKQVNSILPESTKIEVNKLLSVTDIIPL